MQSKVLKPATWKEKGLRWSIGMATLIRCLANANAIDLLESQPQYV